MLARMNDICSSMLYLALYQVKWLSNGYYSRGSPNTILGAANVFIGAITAIGCGVLPYCIYGISMGT